MLFRSPATAKSPTFPSPIHLPEESVPGEGGLVFSSHPVLQGIIISEILGPALAFRDSIERT